MTNVTHLTNQSQFVQANAAFNGTNISGTIASNGISLSVAPGGGGADGYNIIAAGGSTANTTGTIVFSNSNGISFGLNGATVTASHNAITTAMASNRGSDFVQATAAFAGTNATGTIASNGISVSVAPQTAFVFNNSNGVTFGTNGSTVTATVATNYQSQGAYLTTAMQSNAATISNIRVSGGTTSNLLSAITFADGNGVSFGLNAGTMTATVATNYQSQGAYLTTARASNDAIGLNTAQSNVTWTVNSSGLSFDARGYAGTGFSGTNISGTMNSNGLQLSVAPGGGGADGYNILAAGTQTANTTGTILFNNANGITFGMSNSSVITASHNGLTTAMASNRGSDFVQANAAFAGTNASGTIASNGISVSVNAQTVQPVAASASNGSFNFSTIKFVEGSGVTWATQANGIQASVKTDYQSSNANYLTSQSNQAFSASGGSSAFQTLNFANSNGITFSNSNGSVIASHNGLTTARASNDAIGLNTAQSNVTWTVNSSGLSFDARGYAGTGSTFNGTNVSGSMTVNSNGVRLDLSAGAGGGVTPAASASNGSFNFTTINFSNANNVTFGTSAGGIITASVAAPGAAAENNWVNLLGANTTGNTTASGSTIGYSGINLTLSGTNNSVINISAPAVSSLVGVGGISISTNGSTISISNSPVSQRWQYPQGALSALSAFGNGSFSINRMDAVNNVTATRLDMPVLLSIASSATANTFGFAMTVFAAIYTKNGSTLSSLSSGSQTLAFTVASNTAGSTQMLGGAIRPVSVPMNINMTDGEYYVGYGISTNTVSSGTATTANGVTISAMGGLGYSSAIGWVGDFTATTNTSTGMLGGMGVYSAAISTVPPAVSLSAINQTGSYYSRANIGVVFRNI
jgi:hypothetical protein